MLKYYCILGKGSELMNNTLEYLKNNGIDVDLGLSFIGDETSYKELLLEFKNGFINQMNEIKTLYDSTGEITIEINYLYNKEQIKKIENKTNSLLKELVNDNMTNYMGNAIKTIAGFGIETVRANDIISGNNIITFL